MPDILSHWLLGQRLLKNEAFVSAFPALNREAFLWGCQGPDPLFFHRRFPWQTGSLRAYGSLLHVGDPTAILHSLAKICRYCRGRANEQTVFSYALGFCTHYCYDRAAHPLVYYNCDLLRKTEEGAGRDNHHIRIECNLDVMLLRHDTGRLMQDVRLTECLPACENLESMMALLYSLLLCDLFGVHTPRGTAMTIASDYRMHQMLREDPHAFKKRTADAAESLLPYVTHRMRPGVYSDRIHPMTPDMSFDYGNLLHSTWFNPKDHTQRSHLNFYELTDLAEAESLTLTALFAEEVRSRGAVDFAAFTHGIDFHGCHFDAAEAVPPAEQKAEA